MGGGGGREVANTSFKVLLMVCVIFLFLSSVGEGVVQQTSKADQIEKQHVGSSSGERNKRSASSTILH